MALTPKQEKFVQGLISGLSQREAKDKSLYTREQAVKDLIWLQNKSKENIEENGIDKSNATAFLGATKQLTDLNGLNVEKVEVKGSMQLAQSELSELLAQRKKRSDET